MNKILFKKIVNLAASGLSCGTRDLQFLVVACRTST